MHQDALDMGFSTNVTDADDPRDSSASQDRAARLAAMSGRSADILARLAAGDDDTTPAEEAAPAPTEQTADVAVRPERRITGYYRGRPVYADDAPTAETPTTPADTDDAPPTTGRRITGYYRGQPVYAD